ncbi:hypothetical protein [Salinivibrio proteolyticus]|uniref:hypothetical protein n=1 Tax=Salinivibrio proteolyticus TaxID=334715 RepID=UPI001E3007D5|nr:hypothetical protein [Salinivibrio proteolyticus]
MPITEASFVHSQLRCPRYVAISLILFGVIAAWLITFHLAVPLSARALAIIYVISDGRRFYHQLLASQGTLSIDRHFYVQLNTQPKGKMSCVWATPWLVVLENAQGESRIFLWRHGMPDYHFRLIYRHCCTAVRDRL